MYRFVDVAERRVWSDVDNSVALHYDDLVGETDQHSS